MFWNTRIRRTAPALFAAALILPTAQASVRPDDRTVGPRTQAGEQSARPDDRAGIRGIGTVPLTAVRPDDRAGFRGIEAQPVQAPVTHVAVRPDDRGGIRGFEQAPTVIVTGPTGFDWVDAGIGALSAFGLSLLLAGGMLLALHAQKRKQDKVAVL